MDRLLKELPAAEIGESPQAARSVLRLVLGEISPLEALPFDPATCPNCGVTCSSLRTPYCSEPCKEEAAFVRQIRSGIHDGKLFEADRQEALGSKLWHLLGGGYPLRLNLIPANTFQKSLAKLGGTCLTCGAAATRLDHIATGCNRPINLRPACEVHATTRPFHDPGILEAQDSRVKMLAARIQSLDALRSSDIETWDWRAYLNERKSLTAP